MKGDDKLNAILDKFELHVLAYDLEQYESRVEESGNSNWGAVKPVWFAALQKVMASKAPDGAVVFIAYRYLARKAHAALIDAQTELGDLYMKQEMEKN